MATDHPDKPNAPGERGPGYEVRDANPKALLQFAFWMAVTIAVTLVAMKFTFSFFDRMEPLGPPASPLVDTRVLPPGPRLQVVPRQELADYCRAQQKDVNGYSWVDQQSKVVRIPVDRAIDLVLQHGLPARSASDMPTGAAAVEVAPATDPGGTDIEGPCGYLAEASGNISTARRTTETKGQVDP
jgi:hypothetical protein